MSAMNTSIQHNTLKAIGLLSLSALLFSIMGVCIRYASHSLDNYTIVFFRNFVGILIFLPFIFKQGPAFFKLKNYGCTVGEQLLV